MQLRAIKKTLLNIILLTAMLWAARADYCLITNASNIRPADLGMVILGLSFQILALAAIFTAINFAYGYFHFVKSYITNSSLKAVLFSLPFLLFFLSHDPIAYAFYSSGNSLNKIENAKNTDAALSKCCRLPIFYKSPQK